MIDYREQTCIMDGLCRPGSVDVRHCREVLICLDQPGSDACLWLTKMLGNELQIYKKSAKDTMVRDQIKSFCLMAKL